MKIYTRQGDQGETFLPTCGRVSKSEPMIHALGAIDHANAMIGWAMAALDSPPFWLYRVQNALFHIGAELSTGKEYGVSADHVRHLESLIDLHTGVLPELKHFILPGGGEPAARFHLARTAVRDAERQLAALDTVRPEILAYINRLSDLLFVYARWLNHRQSIGDLPVQFNPKESDADGIDVGRHDASVPERDVNAAIRSAYGAPEEDAGT